ncbi:MAG: SPOR domain-containing protein [Flavobacteriaceae bacterium]|jgi:hypothetical protein|nr:SPOR domain-containing protein [Flavobacteriaceae bacterium]
MTKPVYKWLFTIILILLSVSELMAQALSVKIQQDSSITRLMAAKKNIDTENYSSKFYTIQLFYGNNKRAEELYENFKRDFPNWEVDLSFETPNYKVQVGRFKDYYFGLNKLKEIKKVYPAAFLLEIKD